VVPRAAYLCENFADAGPVGLCGVAFLDPPGRYAEGITEMRGGGLTKTPDPHRSSLASCSLRSRTLRAGSAGGLRPSLTSAAPGARAAGGRDGETVAFLGRTERRPLYSAASLN
jgi:hypothetical protein